MSKRTGTTRKSKNSTNLNSKYEVRYTKWEIRFKNSEYRILNTEY